MRQNRIDMDHIIDEYYDRIYKYVYNHIDHKDLARDLTQEVFLALCEKEDRETIEDIQLWLYSVAKNRIALHFRQNYKNKPYETVNALDEAMLTMSYDPFSEYSDEEIEFVKQAVLSSLTDSESALYHAVYESNMNYHSIAEEQNISEVTLRKRSSRIKKKIELAIQKILYCLSVMIYHM